MTQYAQIYREMSRDAQARADDILLRVGVTPEYAIASNQAEIYASKAQREEDRIAREREYDQLKSSEKRRLNSLLNCL